MKYIFQYYKVLEVKENIINSKTLFPPPMMRGRFEMIIVQDIMILININQNIGEYL